MAFPDPFAPLPSRQLRAKFTLPSGNFPGTQSNTLTITGLRMHATLEGSGNYTPTLDLSVYGMRQADMSALTVLWGQNGNPRTIATNALLTLEAGAVSGGWLQVFAGQLIDASPNYEAIPDVCLSVQAISGYAAQVLPVPPTSVQGNADIAQLAQQLATAMHFSFENNGVTGSLSNPYLAGTLLEQWKDLAEAGGFDWYFVGGGTLAICPAGMPRTRNPTFVTLSSQTGLIGYPTLHRAGVECTCLFSTGIELGRPLTIQGSPTPGTNGSWFPYSFSHKLESITPDGLWHSYLKCSRTPAKKS